MDPFLLVYIKKKKKNRDAKGAIKEYQDCNHDDDDIIKYEIVVINELRTPFHTKIRKRRCTKS